MTSNSGGDSDEKETGKADTKAVVISKIAAFAGDVSLIGPR